MSGVYAYTIPNSKGLVLPPWPITFCPSGKHWIKLGDECLRCCRKEELQELIDESNDKGHPRT